MPVQGLCVCRHVCSGDWVGTHSPVALVPDLKVLPGVAPVVGRQVVVAHPHEALAAQHGLNGGVPHRRRRPSLRILAHRHPLQHHLAQPARPACMRWDGGISGRNRASLHEPEVDSWGGAPAISCKVVATAAHFLFRRLADDLANSVSDLAPCYERPLLWQTVTRPRL